ncbi:MAG: 50S ribosomal protein L5 [Opitutales bacterium]|nr:50S ribosomal protein L5 [Opitutales bacterium]
MSSDSSVLKTLYVEKIVPELKKTQGYKNIHDVPKLTKVVINSGVSATKDKQFLEDAIKDIGAITGQKPVVTKARISVSNFKLREGMPVGVKVTLRGEKMWEFLYRFINLALPAIRDFRGVASKLDGNGNYNIGVADHTIFPEISGDAKNIALGMDVTLVTSAKSDDEGRELLRLIGVPFRKNSSEEQAA